jgi:hypothetical protein
VRADINYKKMKKAVSVILFIFSFMTNGYAQKEISIPTKLNNNSIYINAGYLVVYGTLNINYDRMIKQHMWNTNISSFTKVGVGIFEIWGGNGGYTMAQLGILTGENKHHFELSAGLSLNVPKFGFGDEPLGSPFTTNIGWRIQKPNKNFILRLGIGLPEGVYCGLGFSF